MAGRWEDAGVVRGFSTAAANEVLLEFVRRELARRPGLRVLDLGCGAARNAAPMDRLPLRDASVDLVVAHGIWNLTQFAGEPQCFLTEAELVAELLRARFEKDPPGPLTEYNRPVPGRTLTRGGPVIYEGTFRAVRQP